MARAAGKDVLVDLMDAVSELKAGFARQEEHLARVDTRLALMSQRTTEVAERVAMLSSAFTGLAEDQTALRGEFLQIIQTNRETRATIERMARILKDGFASTSDRLDDVEHRLARLEKKAG